MPWGELGVGDLVYRKRCGAPVVARAPVHRFVEIEDCTADRLRQQTHGYRLFERDGH